MEGSDWTQSKAEVGAGKIEEVKRRMVYGAKLLGKYCRGNTFALTLRIVSSELLASVGRRLLSLRTREEIRVVT